MCPDALNTCRPPEPQVARPADWSEQGRGCLLDLRSFETNMERQI